MRKWKHWNWVQTKQRKHKKKWDTVVPCRVIQQQSPSFSVCVPTCIIYEQWPQMRGNAVKDGDVNNIQIQTRFKLRGTFENGSNQKQYIVFFNLLPQIIYFFLENKSGGDCYETSWFKAVTSGPERKTDGKVQTGENKKTETSITPLCLL